MKKSELFEQMKDQLQLKNINETPKVDKVVVSMGIGSIVTRKWHKDFEEFEKNLKTITGQKPQLCKSRKSISNFKLREGMPVMLRVTLRKSRATDFLDRVTKLVQELETLHEYLRKALIHREIWILELLIMQSFQN